MSIPPRQLQNIKQTEAWHARDHITSDLLKNKTIFASVWIVLEKTIFSMSPFSNCEKSKVMHKSIFDCRQPFQSLLLACQRKVWCWLSVLLSSLHFAKKCSKLECDFAQAAQIYDSARDWNKQNSPSCQISFSISFFCFENQITLLTNMVPFYEIEICKRWDPIRFCPSHLVSHRVGGCFAVTRRKKKVLQRAFSWSI